MDKFLIKHSDRLLDALEKLDTVKGLGLIVVDAEGCLEGTLTDGDIRRALNRGVDLEDSVCKAYNRKPVSLQAPVSRKEFEKLTSDKVIKIVPVLDGKKIVDVCTVDDCETDTPSVVIMAGGLGSRLGDLTKDIPKPMLDVAGRPVLERIINSFVSVGFKNIYISVNYKAEVIEEYFGDGSSFDCHIRYLRENKKLGTAGALSLLPKNIQGPIIVTNGDLLTLVDFRRLLHFHNEHSTSVTMCTRRYEFQVPFGVVSIKDGSISSIDEKPTQSFNVSAGIYVLDSDVLNEIPFDQFDDMPNLIERLMKKNIGAACFPMVEQWIDIGHVEDLNYAKTAYQNKDKSS